MHYFIDRPNVLTNSLYTTFVSNADNDECAMDTDNCAEIAICINTPGSFSCTCNEGYIGDGTSCVGKHIPFVIPDLDTIMFLHVSFTHARPTVILIVCTCAFLSISQMC